MPDGVGLKNLIWDEIRLIEGEKFGARWNAVHLLPGIIHDGFCSF